MTDFYVQKKALDELSSIYLQLDEISADTALDASKKADVKAGKLAAAGDKEGAAGKRKQAATLYKAQAKKRLNREALSNWRDDLRELVGDTDRRIGNDAESQQSKHPDSEVIVKEKNVKNKVVIDPEVKLEQALGGEVVELKTVSEKMTTSALEDNCPECGEPRHEGECVAEEAEKPTVEESILWDRIAIDLTRLGEMYGCKFKVEGYQRNPEKGEEEERKAEKRRKESGRMPPRGDKRREDFERWYAANVR